MIFKSEAKGRESVKDRKKQITEYLKDIKKSLAEGEKALAKENYGGAAFSILGVRNSADSLQKIADDLWVEGEGKEEDNK